MHIIAGRCPRTAAYLEGGRSFKYKFLTAIIIFYSPKDASQIGETGWPSSFDKVHRTLGDGQGDSSQLMNKFRIFATKTCWHEDEDGSQPRKVDWVALS